MKTANQEAEIRALKSICDSKPSISAFLLARLTVRHFEYEPCRMIWERISALQSGGHNIPSTATLRTDPILNEESKNYLITGDVINPITEVVTENDAEALYSTLEEYRQLRVLAYGMRNALNSMKGEDVDLTVKDVLSQVDEFYTDAQRIGEDIQVFYTGGDNTSFEIVDRILNEDKPAKIPTGFEQFDSRAGGFARGNVITVAANTGGGKCLVGSTVCLTEHGMLTLDELCGTFDYGFTPLRMTVAGEQGPEPTSQFYRDRSKTIAVRTQLGYHNEGTPEHRVRVLSSAGHVEWKRMDSLEVGDHLLLATGHQMFGSKTSLAYKYEQNGGAFIDHDLPSTMTPELARLLGYMVSDGTFSPKELTPSFTQYSPEVMDDFVRCFEECFPGAGSRSTGFEFTSSSYAKLAGFFDYLGMPRSLAKDKCIPSSIRMAPKHIVAEFLRGLFEGDGYKNDNNRRRVFYTTTSKKLCDELRVVLSNFGILTGTRTGTKSSQDGTTCTFYELEIRKEFLSVFAREIGFVSKRKRELLASVMRESANHDACCRHDKLAVLNPLFYRAVASLFRVLKERKCDPSTVLGSSTYSQFRRFQKRSVTRQLLCKFADLVEDLQVTDLYDTAAQFRQIASYHFSPVVEISEGPEQDVFDFTVPGTHSFIANGLVQHNTVMAIQLSKNMSEAGYNVHLAGFEMTEEEYIGRMLACVTSTPHDVIDMRKWSDVQQKARILKKWNAWTKLLDSKGSVHGLLCPKEDLTPHQITHHVRAADTDVLIVDYIGLVAGHEKLQREERLSTLTREFKLLANKMNCVVIILAQMDEETQNIKYSKAIRHHSSFVWKWLFDRKSDQLDDEGRIIIDLQQEKTRNVAAFDFKLVANFAKMQMYDYEEAGEEEWVEEGDEPVHPRDRKQQKKETSGVLDDLQPAEGEM